MSVFIDLIRTLSIRRDGALIRKSKWLKIFLQKAKIIEKNYQKVVHVGKDKIKITKFIPIL